MDAQPFPWKEVPLRPYHCAPPLRRSKQRANTATQQIKKGLPSAKPKNIIGQRSREKEHGCVRRFCIRQARTHLGKPKHQAVTSHLARENEKRQTKQVNEGESGKEGWCAGEISAVCLRTNRRIFMSASDKTGRKNRG
jgi:hypothetical protein